MVKFLLFWALFLKVAPQISGRCRIPSLIRVSPWFDHYENLVTHSRWNVRYGNHEYTQGLALMSGEVQENAEEPYSCLSSEEGGDLSYYLVVNKGRQTVCVHLIVAPGNLALLQRWRPNRELGHLRPSDCGATSLMQHAQGKWQVRFSGASFPSFGIECPFIRGTYGLNTSGSDIMCLSSAIALVKDTITFSGCYSTGNNERALDSALRCLGYVNGEEFDGGEDDLLLLATTHKSMPRFYCARYSVDDSGTVRMSLYLYSPEDAVCIPGVSSRTTGDLHLAITMPLKRKLSPVETAVTQLPRPGPTARGTRGIGVMGQCTYPTAWQDGIRWWRGYVSSSSSLQDFYYETFTRDAIIKHRQLMPQIIQDQFVCEKASATKVKDIFLVQNVAFQFECREYLYISSVLLLRWVLRGTPGGKIPTTHECLETLASSNQVDVLPQLDRNANIKTMACPFRHVLYQTTIYTDSGYDARGHCDGDTRSTTKINGPVIKINSCLQGDDYAEPFQSEFHCLSTWGPDEVNIAFNTPGHIYRYLLLYYASPRDRPHFYIAKFDTSVDGSVALSLKVNNIQKVRMDLTSDAFTAGDGFIRYQLTPMNEHGATLAPSLTNPHIFTVGTPQRSRHQQNSSTPTPAHIYQTASLLVAARSTIDQTFVSSHISTTTVTTSNTTPTSTSKPPFCNSCQRGVCRVVGQTWMCVCDMGYTGPVCDIFMNYGRCSSNTCAGRGRCLQEGEFYHCVCKQGYIGPNCATAVNCSSSPCSHGTCKQESSGYRCECFLGYSGPNCEKSRLEDPRERDRHDRTVLIVVLTLFVVFTIAFVVIVTIICQRRRRQEENKSITVTSNGDSVIQTRPTSCQNWFPPYRKDDDSVEPENV